MRDRIQRLTKWIDVESVSGDEAAFLQELEQHLSEAGFTIHRQDVAPHRWNLLAARRDDPALLYSTHVDTVPPFIGSRVEDEMDPDDDFYYPIMVRHVIDLLVGDVVRGSYERLSESGVASASQAEQSPHVYVDFSPDIRESCRELKQFLFERVYWHDAVLHDNETSVAAMRQLFHMLLADPSRMGAKARARIPEMGLHRTVADYLAGMTDRYAIEQYRQYIGPFDAPSEWVFAL